MRRAAAAVAATFVGMVMLLHYRSIPIPVTNRTAAGPPVTRPPVAAAAPPPDATPSTRPTSPSSLAPSSTTPRQSVAVPPTTQPRVTTRPPTTAAPSPTTSTTGPSGAPSRQFTGAAAPTQYGNVQVEITMSGSQMTDVTALQMPSDYARSRQISSYAGPQLRQEALDAQSAQIDTVSGATYTSEGYRQSLQSALDQARA